MIDILNIGKKYEGNLNYTLKDINIKIQTNEFIALLGPSGCGKTTLLRMIAGLNSITTGDLLFDGKRVNNIEPKDRNIAMVFQSYALYPHMTVYKNIAYSLMIKKINKNKIDQRVKDVAKLLKIDHILYNKPSEISGGQRQRVALGRAIVRKPKIFLMDEPLSNLDAKLRETMRTELVKIHKLLGTTTIYVTHDQIEAMSMADRIILFNNQKIQQIGKPINLYNNPANLFVAKFIGTPTINTINAEYSNNSIKINNIIYKIKNKVLIEKLKDSKKLIIGLRPEMISITSKSAKSQLKVAYFAKEELGEQSYHKVNIDSDNVFIVKDYNKGNNNYEFGDKLNLALNLENALYFDPETEERIA